MKALGFVLLAGGLAACAQTRYRPSVRPNHASLVIDGPVYVYVYRPTIQAISLDPPFACDAETVRLAREGPRPSTLPSEIEEVEAFSFSTQLSAGAYRVHTVSGPQLDLGPSILVISGEDADDPAVSAVNIVNRFNDVAECLRTWPPR